MRHADGAETPSAVIGAIHARIQHINAISIARVGKYMRVVKSALAILAVTVGQRPAIATIIRAEEAAFIGFHERPHAIAAVSHSHADAANRSIGQAMPGKLFPCCAAIRTAIQSAAWAATLHTPG